MRLSFGKYWREKRFWLFGYPFQLNRLRKTESSWTGLVKVVQTTSQRSRLRNFRPLPPFNHASGTRIALGCFMS